jgi:acyl dehydratase
MDATAHVNVGDTARFSKTLTEADVAMFCAISGDFDPIHVDDEWARRTPFGRRIAHGILSMALLSTVAGMISRKAVERGSRGASVSMGYDRIRFVAPVFIGDTLTASYTVQAVNREASRSSSRVEVHNQRNELVVVGEHLMKWLPERAASSPAA